MDASLKKYRGPGAADRAVNAFRVASHAAQFAQVQKVIRAKRWFFLRHLILRTLCVRDGHLCDLPRGFLPGPEVKKVWPEKLESAVSYFERLSEAEKAERIIEAERLGQHGFLRLLIVRTDCVLAGFISRFPKLSWGGARAAARKWHSQRLMAVKGFIAATNTQRFNHLGRLVGLKLWRALADLVEMGGIGRLGWPGEMPEAVSTKRRCHQRWLEDIREGVSTFGNLPRDKKLERLDEALIFQQTRFLRELLSVSTDGFGGLVDWVPSTVLADAEADEKWMALRLPALSKSADAFVAAVHRIQRLRSEPFDYAVACQAGVRSDVGLFEAWRDGWMAFLRGSALPLTVVPRELREDSGLVLGAWREGHGMPCQAIVLGVEEKKTRRVPISGAAGGALGLEIALRAGSPERDWNEGDAADVLESREAWAWAWRRRILLNASKPCEPPLQLQNIPQILEAWALRAVSNLDSEYSVDEHGMPFPNCQSVALLNGGLLDCWAHAWNQFARRDGRQRVINSVPCELRAHPILEKLCREGIVCLPRDIDRALAHPDESERRRGVQELVKEMKRKPIPSGILPSALLEAPEVRSAWARGWRGFLETRAMPQESIPPMLRGDESVCRAWRRAWEKAVETEVIPWQCLPDCLKADPPLRSVVIEKWLSRAREEGWFGPVVPANLSEGEEAFFSWLRKWHVLPRRREFSPATQAKSSTPEASLEVWVEYLRMHAVRSLEEIPEQWRSLDLVGEAWKKGWVHALQRNAVEPAKIPRALSTEAPVREAFRSGWAAKMRLKPLSLFEIPESLREDEFVVGALVEGWRKRIKSFSEGDVWKLPPGVWLIPVAESCSSGDIEEGPESGEGAAYPQRPWGEIPLSPLWTDAHAQIQDRLKEKCTALFARDSEALKLALMRHVGRPQ